ncbi:MAG TPA: hypothetical protein VFF17_10530 [Thermoanaerobaculia bacterium]|nr:hypothetical protein [Thermoanaerobaculia bacterium]
MATMPDAYIPHKPGDLITAEDWNAMQGLIQNDIGSKIKTAIGDIKKVGQAGDAGTLGGKTPQDLEKSILEKVFQELPKRSGYRMIFKNLAVNEEKVIKHDLKACPLVDVYQLDYFRVVCSEDEQRRDEWVNFYLYHSGEKRFKPPVSTSGVGTIVIESSDAKNHPYKVSFADMLSRYGVEYDDDSSLGDIVTDFWTALFADPNDRFDEDQYCHSPWFDRCCSSEETSVGDLKKRGEWDDLWFQMRPVKTINYPLDAGGQPAPAAPALKTSPFGFQFPHNILVNHFDFDTLGVRLLADPMYPKALTEKGTRNGDKNPNPIDGTHEKVMLLLKV